jgi:hypothetical protein
MKGTIYIPSFLSAMTGMRRGEVAAVCWKWVDLALQLQFSPEMSLARVGLMGPAPG